MSSNIHLSGFSLFRQERQEDQDLVQFQKNPGLIEKILICKWMLLTDQQRFRYIIQAQMVLDNYVRGKIYMMAKEKNMPLKIAFELERIKNIKIRLKDYQKMVDNPPQGVEKVKDDDKQQGIQIGKKKKLKFIEFHSTPQSVNMELYKNLRQSLIEDFEFKDIERYEIGGRQSLINIIGVFEESTINIYTNDRKLEVTNIPQVVEEIVRKMKLQKILIND